MADTFSDTVLQNACERLRFSELKEKQKEGAKAILQGKDLFVALPTGFGKSAIYQIVPFAVQELQDQNRPKTSCYFALVICPLNSLICDQINQLQSKGIRSLSLGDSATTPQKISEHNYSFLFTSPEAVLGDFRKELKRRDFQEFLMCVVIDESHCIVNWGLESKKTKRFRYQYGKIADLRSLWTVEKNIPFVAMTATATEMVRKEIIQNLQLQAPLQIIESPQRKNIRYSVFKMKEDNSSNLVDFLAKLLKKDGRWACESTNSSIAFGMGVDCKSLHHVIHYGPPTDIDYYCQETGRAGRDQEQSDALLILFPKCFAKNTSLAIKEYCKNTEKCRRELMLSHFKGSFDKVTPGHNCCDICSKACTCVGCSDSSVIFHSMFELALHAQENTIATNGLIIHDIVMKELSDTLISFREALFCELAQKPLYTGAELAIGFPSGSVEKIKGNFKQIQNANDVMRLAHILDAGICNSVFQLIKEIKYEYDYLIVDIASNEGEPSETGQYDSPESDFWSSDSEDGDANQYAIKPLVETDDDE
eukprot:gene1674-1864_t